MSTAAFTGSSANVNEGATGNSVIVSRVGNVPGSFTVTLTGAHSANGHDLTGFPSSLTFSASDTSKSFNYNVPTDSLVEGDWTYTFTLSAPTNGAQVGSQSYTVYVHDTNVATPTPLPTLSTLSGTITYMGVATGGITVSAGVQSTMTLSDGTFSLGNLPNGQSGMVVTVSLNKANGIATGTFPITTPASGGAVSWANSYNLMPATVTVSGTVTANGGALPAGTATVTVRGTSITATTDTAGVYTLTGVPGDTAVTLDASYNGHSGSSASFTTRADGAATNGIPINVAYSTPTPPTVAFASPSFGPINEGSSGTVTVSRFGDASSAFDVTIAVTWTSVVGHTVTVNTPVHFNAGATSPSAPVTVTVPANTQIEGDWTATLALSNPTNGVTLDSQNTCTLNIHDTNVASVVQFSTTVVAPINEGQTATYTVTRNGNTPDSFDMPLTVNANGHTVTAPASVHFNAGDTSVQFTIQVPTNTVWDNGNWHIDVGFGTPPAGVSVGTNSQFTQTVIDMNVRSSVTFLSTSTVSVPEGGYYDITLTRMGDTPASFDVTLAASGTGFTTPTGWPVVSFGPNDQTKTVRISIPGNDGVAGDSRDIVVSMQGATGNAQYDARSLTIHVVDQESPPTIGFTAAGASTSTGYDVTVAVFRYGLSTQPASAVVSLSGGSAVAGTDFTTSQTMPWTVNFAAGETQQTFTVHINDAGAGKNIVFQLGSFTGATAGPITQYTLSVKANNPAPTSSTTFQFDTTRNYANSGDVTVKVTRYGVLTGTNTVQVWVGGASNAILGTDYKVVPTVPVTLSFGPGETSKSITVSIIGDHKGAGARNVMLVLASPTGGATLGAQNTYLLTIGDGSGTPTTTVSPTPLAESTVTPTPTPTPGSSGTPTPVPTTSEATNINWSWLLLLALIPLVGVVIYYFAFVREK